MKVILLSSLNPSVSCSVKRTLRVREFGGVHGEFDVIVPNAAYRVRRVDWTDRHPKYEDGPEKGKEKEIKPGSFILINTRDHASWKCDPKEPVTWMHTHHDTIFLACRAAEKIHGDVKHNRLPAHARFSTTARLLHAYAVEMRKNNPATISRVERRAQQALGRCLVTSRHPMVVEARRRVKRATKIKIDRLPSYYASLWSARWLLDKRVAALTTIGMEFGRLHDALMAYNGSIATVWAAHVGSLNQILHADEFATAARPERLREIADSIEGIEVRPWVRSGAHVVEELRRAAELLEEDRAHEAKELTDRAYRSMKIALARYSLELQLAKVSLGFTLKMEPSEPEVQVIADVAEEQLDVIRSTDDTDFELPILQGITPMLEEVVEVLRNVDLPTGVRISRLYHVLKERFIAA